MSRGARDTVPRAVVRACLAGAAVVVLAPPGYAQPAVLELRIASEEVPPRGVLQAKVEVTEPRPISTGSGSFDLGQFEELLGVAVTSLNDDTAAAAVIRGSGVRCAWCRPRAGWVWSPITRF